MGDGHEHGSRGKKYVELFQLNAIKILDLIGKQDKNMKRANGASRAAVGGGGQLNRTCRGH